MTVTVGLLGPPDWDDPTPAEYRALTGHRVLGYRLPATGFRRTLDEIGGFEPSLIAAATRLAGRGAAVIGIVGTPFGWAGLEPGQTPHDRNRRIAACCGVPVVSAVSGILDQLHELDATNLGLAVTYYDESWKRGWKAMLARLGFTVTAALSLEDVGLVAGALAAEDRTHWAPGAEQIQANVEAVAAMEPDAVVVTGAGARTLSLSTRWRSITPLPVVAADTALYAALDRVTSPV